MSRMGKQIIWVLETESILDYGVKIKEQKMYLNKPNLDDLVADVLMTKNPDIEKLSKMKLLADEHKLNCENKKYRIYPITLIQN